METNKKAGLRLKWNKLGCKRPKTRFKLPPNSMHLSTLRITGGKNEGNNEGLNFLPMFSITRIGFLVSYNCKIDTSEVLLLKCHKHSVCDPCETLNEQEIVWPYPLSSNRRLLWVGVKSTQRVVVQYDRWPHRYRLLQILHQHSSVHRHLNWCR